MIRVGALLLLLAATVPSVEYDPQVDFSRYHTWSWREGSTPAMNPVTDNRIREAIERGLAARGLSQVDGDATLLVVYHASRTTQIDVSTFKYAATPSKTGLRYVQKASLLVDMLDADSGKVVWRGHASGVLRYGPQEIAEQVKAAVDELLTKFPPGAPPRDSSGQSPEP